MAKAHYFQLHIGDIIKDTYHLPPDVFGAYMRLLMAHYSMGEEGIPADTKTLTRIAGVTPHQWSRMQNTIKNFFTEVGGSTQKFWVHKRVVVELKKQEQISESQRAKSQKRWNIGDAGAYPESQPELMPEPMPQKSLPVTSNQEPIDSKEITSPRAHTYAREDVKQDVKLETVTAGTPSAGAITQGLAAGMKTRPSSNASEGSTWAEYIRAHDIQGVPDPWLQVGRVELRNQGVDPQQIGKQAERFHAFFLNGNGSTHRSRDWGTQFLGFVRKTRSALPSKPVP